MKKLIMLSLLVMSTLAASAEIKFQSIDNKGATNVVLTDTDAPDDAKITDAVLYCNGKEYRAKNIRCNVVAGVAVYRLQFKRLTVFSGCKVTVTVNGKKTTVDIQKHLTH